MADPSEQWDDAFKEKTHDSTLADPSIASRANMTTQENVPPPSSLTTPFAQSQTTYTFAEPLAASGPLQGPPAAPQAQDPLQKFYSNPLPSESPGFMPPQSTASAAMRNTPPMTEQQQQEATTTTPQTFKFWTVEFFQQFFDVDTRLVLLRMSNALVPLNPPDFLMDREWRSDAAQSPFSDFQEMGVTWSRKPDLYGPFWISTTLWMTLAIVSNVMSRIAFSHGTHSKDERWNYDFTMASVACIVIYLYCFGLGSIVWGMMKYNVLPISLADTLCLYGYSMFVFFPVGILCTIPVPALQWIFVLVGGVWSAAYLLVNFWSLWRGRLSRAWFVGILTTVIAFHAMLTISFKFYFLNYKF